MPHAASSAIPIINEITRPNESLPSSIRSFFYALSICSAYKDFAGMNVKLQAIQRSPFEELNFNLCKRTRKGGFIQTLLQSPGK
jgi:hypothetical protein